MKKLLMLLTAFVLIFNLLLTACSKQDKDFDLTGNLINDISNFFPLGRVDVNILQISVPPENKKRYDEIVSKVITGYEENKDYFKDSIIWKLDERIYKMKDGIFYNDSPVSWNERFGVSYEEYEEIYGLIDFCKTGEGVVTIDKKDKDTLVIKPEQNIKNLDHIDINISKKTVSTMYGHYKYHGFRKAPTNKPAKFLYDRWGEYDWTIDTEKSSLKNSRGYNSFYIGQIKSTKEIIIFLRNDSNDGPEHQNIIFSFNAKKE